MLNICKLCKNTHLPFVYPQFALLYCHFIYVQSV
jgi:hypothetical protein